jgi:heavy metal sensor kinase
MSRVFFHSSIRFKLTLVYAVVVFVTMLAFMGIVYRSVINNLESGVDADLKSRAEQAQAFLAHSGFSAKDLDQFTRAYGGSGQPSGQPSKSPYGATPGASPGATPMPDNPALNMNDPNDLASALTYLQLVDTEGNVLSRIPELKVMSKPANQAALVDKIKDGTGFSYIKVTTGERARVYTLQLDRVNNRGFVQVVRSLQEADAIVSGLIWPFIILAIIAFCLLAVFGWWFTRRTFAPLEEITETAYRIGVNGDLNERIKTDPYSNDEISRLGRAFNAMLERLDKNFKAQKQFIADSSHELRTPLTVIRGNVDLLKRNPDPENQSESLQAIERESARMQRLVQDLLLLAQADARQTVEMASLPLDDIVLEVFKETRVLADQRHQQLKLGHFDPVVIEGDRDRLKRAILNLVDNAIKYTPEEGQITLSLVRGKQWVRVTVEDNGPGIAERDQGLIFDRFYRVDKARSRQSTAGMGGGSGLGLAIVKHIVEAHGGRISLESTPGQGSTFTIWLKTPTSEDLPPDEDDDINQEAPKEEPRNAPPGVSGEKTLAG